MTKSKTITAKFPASRHLRFKIQRGLCHPNLCARKVSGLSETVPSLGLNEKPSVLPI